MAIHIQLYTVCENMRSYIGLGQSIVVKPVIRSLRLFTAFEFTVRENTGMGTHVHVVRFLNHLCNIFITVKSVISDFHFFTCIALYRIIVDGSQNGLRTQVVLFQIALIRMTIYLLLHSDLT